MDISMTLAQMFGIYLVVMGLLMWIRKKAMKKIIGDFFDNVALVFITGLLVFILGLIIVSMHNIWSGGWIVVVTVFGWLVLLKGIMYLFVPAKYLEKMTESIMDDGWYHIGGLVAFVIGLYLLFMGF